MDRPVCLLATLAAVFSLVALVADLSSLALPPSLQATGGGPAFVLAALVNRWSFDGAMGWYNGLNDGMIDIQDIEFAVVPGIAHVSICGVKCW